jgi:hypothetical protein
MLRTLALAVGAAWLGLSAWAADPAKHTVKTAVIDVPKEFQDPVRQLFTNQAVQVLDDKGQLLCEFWFRKDLPVKAKPDEIKAGVKYRQLEQSTILAAVRFAQEWHDFRKQKIKKGIYTLRLGYPPSDGNHQGIAPQNEFGLLLPAADDKKPDLMEFKLMNEISAKSTAEGTHAGVVLLYPNEKPGDKPALVSKGEGIWVLNWKEDATAGTQKTMLGLGLTLFGATTAE